MSSHRLGHALGPVQRCVWQQHDELLSAIPAPQVTATQRFLHGGTNRAQDAVTKEVSVSIVQLLKMVEVDKQQRHQLFRALSATEFCCDQVHAVVLCQTSRQHVDRTELTDAAK